MIIKWLGHASFLIKTLDKRIYIDPYAGDYTEKADVILITHGHLDHCDSEKISSILQAKTVIVTSKECSKQLSGNIVVLAPGETKEIMGLIIRGTESYNYKRFRSPGVPFHPKEIQIGFLIETESKTIYHAGDTDFLPSMKELGKVDIAFIPIGGHYTMDLNEAVEATLAINPKLVVPIHRREASAEKFKENVENQSDIMVIILDEGEEMRQ